MKGLSIETGDTTIVLTSVENGSGDSDECFGVITVEAMLSAANRYPYRS